MSAEISHSAVYNLAGVVGVILYVLGYALLQLGVVRGRGYAYISLNLAASSLVLVSLINAFNLYSAIIQILWITISAVGLWRTWRAQRAIAFSQHERHLLTARFPLLSPALARAFLDAGRWRDVAGGQVLASEGQVLDRLIFLSDGAARVENDGAILAEVTPPAFLGELTVLSGGPATATVRTTAPGHVFDMAGDTLRRLLAREPEISPHLDAAMRGDMADKLKAANRKLARAEARV